MPVAVLYREPLCHRLSLEKHQGWILAPAALFKFYFAIALVGSVGIDSCRLPPRRVPFSHQLLLGLHV